MWMQAKRSWRAKAGVSLLSAGVLAGGFAGVAAAKGSGGQGPGRGGVLAGLTQQQRACIKAQGITRRGGRPTPAERRAIFEAAKKCGVALPDPASRNPAKHGGGHHRHGRWSSRPKAA
jgi:hypothetical protein